MSTLNLNAVHTDLLAQILKLTRYQYIQRLKSIDHCFKSSLSRLREDEVYTGDEVESIVTALQDTVRSEVETELTDSSHTNGLLLQQLLSNAEQWHLTLTVDISELENREKLDMIKDFEAGKPLEKMSITVTQSKQIIPVQDLNVASGLKIEIAKLKEANDVLEDKLKEAELKNQSLLTRMELNEEKASERISQLSQNIGIAEQEIQRLTEVIRNHEKGSSDMELQSVQNDIKQMSLELEKSRGVAEDEAENLRKDLELREDKLRQVQSALLLTEKELEKKFQATSAYLNMKKILVQKNTMIKSLRQKLVEAGGNPDAGIDSGTPCDDD